MWMMMRMFLLMLMVLFLSWMVHFTTAAMYYFTALAIGAVISHLLVPKKDGGVIAVFEVMINTSAIENHIRKGETYKITSDIQTGKKRGMILLDDHLLELMREGLITRDTVLEYAQDRVEMRTRLA